MAENVVIALWSAVESLKDADGMLMGVTEDPENMFTKQEWPSRHHTHSLVSSIWEKLCFDKAYNLLACKHCGCCLLADKRRSQQKYCSDSCRARDKTDPGGLSA